MTLGGPKLPEARERAVASIKALADQHAANVLPVIREIRKAGAGSLHQIAEALNARGASQLPAAGNGTRHRCGMYWRGLKSFRMLTRLCARVRSAGLFHDFSSADVRTWARNGALFDRSQRG